MGITSFAFILATATATKMGHVRRSLTSKSRSTSSKVTNGSKLFLPGVDGRSAVARRARDIFDAICSDLGGHDRLSEAQTQLVRRAAMISIQCEQLEAIAAAGREIDLDVFGKLTDRLGRTLQRLGLKRQPRDITPRLGHYVKQRVLEGEVA